MRLGACVIGTRESWIIRACLTSLKIECDQVIYVTSDRYWNGERVMPNDCLSIAREIGVWTLEGFWQKECDMRAAGVEKLEGMDMVLILDADEVYTVEQLKRLRKLFDNEQIGAWRSNTRDFFKLPCFETSLREHKAFIALDPRRCFCTDEAASRDVKSSVPIKIGEVTDPDLWPRHYGYVRSDEDILKKLEVHGDKQKVRPNWFRDKWVLFDHSDMDFWPFEGPEQYKHLTLVETPDEIRKLLDVPGDW